MTAPTMETLTDLVAAALASYDETPDPSYDTDVQARHVATALLPVVQVESDLAKGFQSAWAQTSRMLGLAVQLAASWGGITVQEMHQFLVNQGMTEADAAQAIRCAEDLDR